MSVKRRGLGRSLSDLGLNELLSRVTPENHISMKSDRALVEDAQLKKLPLSIIIQGKYQPRKDMNNKALQELAESIRSQGIIQPIVVRAIDNERYEIIAGERRWRAAQLAGLKEIPVIIRDIPDNAAIAMALIENIQRENLNAIEEATALHRLSQEFSLTHQEIATVIGKSRTTVSNLLRLLTLSTNIKQMVEKGDLEMGHARALLSLDEIHQAKVANQIVLKAMSVRETELYIRRLVNLSDVKEPKVKDQNLLQIEKNLSKRLGARVAIKSKDEKKGKVILYYRSKEQLDHILTNLEK